MIPVIFGRILRYDWAVVVAVKIGIGVVVIKPNILDASVDGFDADSCSWFEGKRSYRIGDNLALVVCCFVPSVEDVGCKSGKFVEAVVRFVIVFGILP